MQQAQGPYGTYNQGMPSGMQGGMVPGQGGPSPYGGMSPSYGMMPGYSGSYPPSGMQQGMGGASQQGMGGPAQQGMGGVPQQAGQVPFQEESYIENILRMNLGKEATIYMTFEGDKRQTFQGILEAAGRDHIIISDPQTGRRYLLLMVYLDYITFNQPLNYTYPYTPQPSRRRSKK